ncbi:protein kinase domain-containing protein [Actinomycetospora cinnamomea]|uniref:non-specific serine/threonine protein kinase n=1 Tax=Actinomycetospora cinnamomea TaxID=663609 RepID=A0A2U1F9S7_9PSEU|nr:serine/threonine protein kinase [Actinomycetospora cinnamomea]
MAAPTVHPAGTVLEGRYRVDGLLARGGMSVVHRGSDLRLDRPVAIKILDRTLAADPAFVRRFEREARAAARLAHPGVVAVHDQGRDPDGTVFLVLELVEGGTLRDVLRDEGRLHPATALTVAEQVVTALQVAHDRGLVHRDVKPENVLVGLDGTVKVADFGLVAAAWETDGADDPEGNGEMVLGTVAYLAPEQVAEGRADARSDLYAAGVVLFELLTGAPPHGGEDAVTVARRHVHSDVPPPSALVGGIPRALDRLVLAATSRDPEARLADAGAFLAAARGVRIDADLPFHPVPPPRRRAGSAGSRPLRGTRLLDLDEGPGDPPRRGPWDDLDEDLEEEADLDDLAEDEPEDEPEDDGPARTGRRGRRSPDAPVDDVDVAIETIERRRARARSRRLLAAWLVLVSAATVAAGAAGWGLGLP